MGCTTLALNAALLLRQRHARRGPPGLHDLQADQSCIAGQRAGGAAGVRYLAARSHGHGGNGRCAPVGRHPDSMLLIDCPAGWSPPLQAYAAVADLQVVVVTPEPAALADGYGLLKLLAAPASRVRTGVVVNKAASRSEAESVAARLICTARQFLGRTVEALGYVPLDPHVLRADRAARPLSLQYPRCPASVCLGRVCERLRLDVAGARGNGLWPRLASLLL